MFTFRKKQQRGFTLIELMVVVGIIIILLSIIFASVSQARQNTREKKRVADLANIELAMTLYREDSANRVYPSYINGVEIGVGGAIDAVIRQYNGNVYRDPNSDGVSGGNEYWYDSSFTCSSTGQAVLFVRSMEQAKNANFNTLCTANNRDTAIAGASSYIVVLKQ